jgi:hypothetical protein
LAAQRNGIIAKATVPIDCVRSGSKPDRLTSDPCDGLLRFERTAKHFTGSLATMDWTFFACWLAAHAFGFFVLLSILPRPSEEDSDLADKDAADDQRFYC